MSADQKAREIIATALGLPVGAVSENMRLETCPEWDSLAHFRVVSGVEAVLGRELNPMEIAELEGFESVMELLQ